MNHLLSIIEPIIQWGITPKLKIENKELILKKSLLSLYQEYLALEGNVATDEKEYPEAPEFNFEKISNTIRSNFPELGFYQMVLDPFDLEKPNNGLGDANDDLSDIIKDLMEVQWRFQNTSETDAIWYFEFIMRNNSEQHLVNFLKTVKDLEEHS
ncbi:DUF5063 domain-containing protein [uncultured Aquimarina sp.]|uniref:DUF5063 domain-containing protein n=1 Tax=uncultured Aquimarina sp. TaxID=575652 RepID=UPI0026018D4B|nr:DUF5063 domain-containing protein [uncultured Aquimarina sp.]